MIQLYGSEKFATVGLVLMFILSGTSKLIQPRFDQLRLSKVLNQTGLNLNYNEYINVNTISMTVIMLVGVFEVVSSSIILYDVFMDKRTSGRLSSMSEYAVVSLSIFTILATLLFYVFPFKYRAVLANTSTLSSLLFAYQIIKRRKSAPSL